MNYLIKGSDMLAAQKDFHLVGRDGDLERLTSILLRSESSSIILVGPGGVGCSALCLGLQASKEDPDAPFDVINKRLFWLDTDGLFSSGTTSEISANFEKIISILNRTPDSVLIIEDARDFIDAARSNGLGNFINSLNNAVKKDKTQVILETRDEDLDVVLKSHSDMREAYTLIDLEEPIREALAQIAAHGARQLAEHHGIRVHPDAVEAAIELTTKYRTRDAGLSRAQPERTLTLIDRALSTFRLNAHREHHGMRALLASLGDRVSTPEGQAEIARLNTEYAESQKAVKLLYREQRDGEAAILEIEQQIDAFKKEDEARAARGETMATSPEPQRISSLSAFHEISRGGGFESTRVTEARARIEELQKLVGENREKFLELTRHINEQLELSRDAIVEQFSMISGIPANRLNQDERKKLRCLEENMRQKVFGQDSAIRKLADAIKVAKVGRRMGGEPLASFLFMGPSGVGKTELAKVLTANLLDDAGALTRFDMSEYMEKHAVAKLIGAPPGYEGFEVGGILTNAMRKNPMRVLLFDEIEKAHPDVFNIFLQILSDSRLTDNVGRVVSFDDAVIIMTTNIGQADFLNVALTDDEAEAAARIELEATYRPELLNRFAGRENIVSFRRLGLDSIARIVRREALRIAERYESSGVTLEFPDEAIAVFCADKYDPATGARGLPGYIKANLEPVFADLVLDNPDFQGTIVVSYDPVRHAFGTVIRDTQENENETQRSVA